jgi:hypothetical protein
MCAFKPRSPPLGGGAGGVGNMDCLNMWMDFARRRVKRILHSQNYIDKFYPHSFLTINLQLSTVYKAEIDKFTKVWCDGSNLINEVEALKEIFETENKNDMVWIAELLSNKHVAENVDRLTYVVSTMKR